MANPVRALIGAVVTALSCILSAASDGQPATIKVIPVWTGDDVPFPSGSITRDGRYLVFAGDALYIRDLAAKKTEVRSKTDAGFATEPRPSPDNQWIAVAFRDCSRCGQLSRNQRRDRALHRHGRLLPGARRSVVSSVPQCDAFSLWFAPAGGPDRQLVAEIPDSALEVA
jgi:hypothetical protein